MDKLKALADEIEAEGGVAKGYTCNVMNKANCLQVAEDVLADLGPCDILVNGAGGNNSRANTDKEYFEMGDLDTDTVTFFDLDESGVEMVFNLNFIGTLLPTQAFARQMVGREGCNIINISSMNAYLPRSRRSLRTPVRRPPFPTSPSGWPFTSPKWASAATPSLRASSPARPECKAPLQRGRYAHGAHRQDSRRHPAWAASATASVTSWARCSSC